MTCPFCAEEIREAAVWCRFCGAQKREGTWVPPQEPTGRRRSGRRLVMLMTGWFLLATAGFELFSITSAVPLFGALRGGTVALLYHLLFAALFVAMGLALLARPRWGGTVILAGTLVYGLDRAAFILDTPGRQAYLRASFGQQLAGAGSGDLVDGAIALTAGLTLAAWLVFALYVYLNRAYFRSP